MLKNLMLSLTLFGSIVFVISCNTVASFQAKGNTRKVELNSEQGSTTFYVVKKDRSPLRSNKNYYWYKTQNIYSTQGDYSGELLHDWYVSYHPNGQLKEKGKFRLGLKVGDWKTFDQNGNLLKEIKWKCGISQVNQTTEKVEVHDKNKR